MRTIFRFPGGKQSLLKFLRPFLDQCLVGKDSFHDVFVGGGSVLLDVAIRYSSIQLFANDGNAGVAAFWRVVASSRVKELCRMIQRTRPSVALFKKMRESDPSDEIDLAFRTFFLNRCSFSGLPRASPLGGWNQTSEFKIDCRWNMPNLITEIEKAGELLSGRLVVSSMDAVEYVLKYKDQPKYLDPPYLSRGNALYECRMDFSAHLGLATALRQSSSWVLSYDNTPVVQGLYSWADLHLVPVGYRINRAKRRWADANEVVIASFLLE